LIGRHGANIIKLVQLSVFEGLRLTRFRECQLSVFESLRTIKPIVHGLPSRASG